MSRCMKDTVRGVNVCVLRERDNYLLCVSLPSWVFLVYLMQTGSWILHPTTSIINSCLCRSICACSFRWSFPVLLSCCYRAKDYCPFFFRTGSPNLIVSVCHLVTRSPIPHLNVLFRNVVKTENSAYSWPVYTVLSESPGNLESHLDPSSLHV